VAADRQTTREALATECAAYITSVATGGIFDHKPDDLGGIFPAVAFEAVGSERRRDKFTGLTSVFYFSAHLFVLYANEGQSWTKAQADDALDALENELANFIEAKPKVTGNWNNLSFNGQTTILDNVDMGGERYIDEIVPLRVEVYG